MEAIAPLHLFEQRELFGIWRIIGHYSVLAAVMNDPLSTDILDDGGVAAGILDCEMKVRLVATCLNHDDLDGVQQRERIADIGCSSNTYNDRCI